MYQRPNAPRTIGGVLDDSFRLYRATVRDWWLPSLLLALLSSAGAIFLTLRIGLRATPADLFAFYRSPPMLLALLVRIVLSVWFYMTVLAAIAAAAVGEEHSVRDAFGKGLRVTPFAIVAGILYGLAVLAGCVLLLIPGLYVLGRLQFWPVALVVGRPRPVDALAGSWRMVKGYWWRTVTILSVLLFMLLAMFLLIGFTAGLLVVVMRPNPTAAVIAAQGIAGLLNVVITPVFPAAAVATYLDLRLRAEGGDLESRVRDLKPG
jgi:hypothetical protein